MPTGVVFRDHNDECIGCGAHRFDPEHDSECPVNRGRFTPAVVLRYACKLLTTDAANGCDLRWVIRSAALALTDVQTAEKLHPLALAAVTDYLTQQGETGDLGAEQLLDRAGRLLPRAEIALTFYAAAAAADDIDFDPEDFGDFH